MNKESTAVGNNDYENYIIEKSSPLRDHILGYVSNTGLVIWLLSYTVDQGQLVMPVWQLAAGAASGIVLWTFVEYWMHRGPYHHYPKITRTGHELHHRFPKALLGIPYYITLILVVSLFLIFQLFFDKPNLGLVMGFMWIGYIAYTLVHHASHQLSHKNPLFRNIRRHHLIHHAHPDKNFGFLTTFWDRVFGTLYVSKSYKPGGRAIKE